MTWRFTYIFNEYFPFRNGLKAKKLCGTIGGIFTAYYSSKEECLKCLIRPSSFPIRTKSCKIDAFLGADLAEDAI